MTDTHLTEQPTPTPKIYAYLRVSTYAQDLENQQHGIIEYAKNHNLQPVTFHEEKISGTTPLDKRKLKDLIHDINTGDTLIISESSRLGRNMIETLTIIDTLIKKDVRIHTVKGGYRLDGSISSKILCMVLSMASEIERDLISQRTKEAIAKRRAEGKPIGRPKGSLGTSKLDKHEKVIRDYIQKGVSKASIAKIFDATWPTVNTFCKRRGI